MTIADPDYVQPAPPEASFVEDTAHHENKRLTKGAVSMFAGRLLNFGLQAAYFVILARLLRDAQEYGIFSGVFALVGAVTPYSAAGFAVLFMRYIPSAPKDAPAFWGNALAVTTLFTAFVCALAVLLGHRLAHPYMTAVLLLGNCLFSQVTALAGMLLFALDKLRMSALLSAIANVARFAAVVCLKLYYTHVSAGYWAVAFTASSFVAAAYAFAQVSKVIGRPVYRPRLLKQHLAKGFGYAFAGSTEAVNNDFDKMALAHFGMNFQNGFYTLAYRIVDVATSPIVAVCASVTQRQFQLGHRGIVPVMQLARKSIAVAVGIGLLLVVPIVGMARFVPMLVGSGYFGAVQVLYWLCWLPVLRAVHQLAGAAISGLGRQPLRVASQACAAVLSVLLNFLWVPLFGWKGAAGATLICDGTMAVLNSAILLYLKRSLSRAEAVGEPRRGVA